MWVNAEPNSQRLLSDGNYQIGVIYSTDDPEPRQIGGFIELGTGQGIDEFNAAVIQQLDDLNAQDIIAASQKDLAAVVDSIVTSGPVDVVAVRQVILAKATGTVDTTIVVPKPPVTSTPVLP